MRTNGGSGIGSAPGTGRTAIVRALTAASLALAAGVAGSAPAEARQEAGEGEAVVRDSAGVPVVENAVPGGEGPTERVPGLRLSERPVLDVGSVTGEGPAVFHRIQDVALLSDGRIAVADGGSGEIRIFGSGGEHLRTVGGAGGGPGEFMPAFGGATGLVALGRTTGDTIRAYDMMAGRVTVFGPRGDLVRTVPLAAPPGDLGARADPVGWLDDGTFVARARRTDAGAIPRSEEGEVYRPDETLVFYDPEGQVRDTVGRFRGDASFLAVSRPDASGRMSVSSTEPPFAHALRAAAGADRVAAGSTDGRAIRIYGPDGGLERVVLLGRGPRPVTEERMEAWVDDRLSAVDDADRRRRLRDSYRRMPRPETSPAFGPVLLDGRGRLWIADYRPSGSDGPGTWTAHDRQGRRLSRLEVPGRFRPTAVADGRVAGVWEDELGVQHVRVYELPGVR